MRRDQLFSRFGVAMFLQPLGKHIFLLRLEYRKLPDFA